MQLPQNQQAALNARRRDISANVFTHEDIHTTKKKLQSYHQEGIIFCKHCLILCYACYQ